ncbi:MAG: protein kinase, partial [Planctomycetales bacterium]|nr:protein kinase [Planctomycetales bacterium]
WDSTRQAIHVAGYDLGRRIGGGSYGEVFEAAERSNRRRVAIKVVIDPAHERSMLSFAREVRLLGSDHVPRDVMPVLLTSRNESGIQPFHAMEFIDGRVIHEFARQPRPLKMLERCELIERMLRAAHRMHESNLIHGDIQPNNVLASGERVHFVDFGMAGRNEQLYPSLNSFAGPRGTPGFQTNDLARGERRPEVSDDIFSASAVGFYVLTDVLVEKFQKPQATDDAPIEHDFRQIEATLREKTVPAGVRRILLKGLHQKDKRRANDTSVYATAEQMANELAAWRNAQLRRRQRWTQIGVTAALLLMALLLAWRGWALYWAELNARDLVRLGDLQREVAGLPNADEAAVDRHLDEAEQALGRRDAALARDDSPAAREAMAEALAALRQAISVSQGIERARPLRRALGEVLNRMPWIATSTVIASEKRQLDNQYESIAELIDAG